MSPDHPLIFDASVAINFLGSGAAMQLVPLLGHSVLMAERAFSEIKRHPLKGADHTAELDALIKAGALKVVPLTPEAKDLFYELAGGDIAGGLDDGEAATIAMAATSRDNATPILDDRKARNVLLRRWPSRSSHYTIDLLASERITKTMKGADLANAVYSALFNARMRVPEERRDWVLELIGAARAKDCACLGTSLTARKV